ncbi:MAG: LTA synthase family protein, partial [Lachnospiraceae bacterium]|nr:LTA synthase family protein [Lachnospiraceae bacterium]
MELVGRGSGVKPNRETAGGKMKTMLPPVLFSGALILFVLINNDLFFGKSTATDKYGLAIEADRPLFFALAIGAPLVAAALHILIHTVLKRNGEEERTVSEKVLTAALVTGNAFLSFFLIELINNPWYYSLDARYKLLGWGITLMIDLIFIGIFNSVSIGMILGNIFFLVWGIANYYVLAFRSIPLQYIDFFSIKTAMNVAGNYEFSLAWQIVTAVSVTLSVLGVYAGAGLLRVFQKRNGKVLVRGAALILAFSFHAVIFKTDFLADQGIWLRDWHPQYTYKLFGMEAGFLAFAKASNPEPPVSYSGERVEEIIGAADENRAAADKADPVIPENFIVVMNESFADLTVYPNLRTKEEVMPFFNSLAEEAVSGYLRVSVLGGTTANTEYEFLTGNSCMISPSTVVYNSFIKSDQFSLARTLKAQGYRAVAMHPYYPNGWNREFVYPRMGFDEFISMEGFKGADRERDFVSDLGDYERLIEEVEKKKDGEKLFIFNVTMQNHSGYETKNYPVSIHVNGYEGEFLGEAEQYESLIRKSDEALEYLIDYFKKCDEKTMIVFFGDHQPSLSEDFLAYALGKDADDFTFEDEQKQYMTRYLIWANYDLPEAEGGIMSANYLASYALSLTGLQGTSYNDYLLGMRDTVPAVNAYGYETADGIMHQHGSGEDPEAERLLEDYSCLIYN